MVLRWPRYQQIPPKQRWIPPKQRWILPPLRWRIQLSLLQQPPARMKVEGNQGISLFMQAQIQTNWVVPQIITMQIQALVTTLGSPGKRMVSFMGSLDLGITMLFTVLIVRQLPKTPVILRYR